MAATGPVVRREIVVDASLEVAFDAFTRRFGDFKPPELSLMASLIDRTEFEPRIGGHIVVVAVDGSECRWARILAYDPPNRVVFSWDISPQWSLESDPASTSEVEVRFMSQGDGATRLESAARLQE